MSLKEKSLLSLVISGAIFLGFMFGVSYFKDARTGEANVNIGAELQATTTGATGGAGFTGSVARIQYDVNDTNAAKQGMLGSIYFAAPTVSRVCAYDATTTNVNLRTGNMSSTTLLIGCFPSGTGTSTVPLNVAYRFGLIFAWDGTVSSTTITSR